MTAVRTKKATTSAPGSPLTRMLENVEGLLLKPGEPLADHSTFRIGGPAELLVIVESENALGSLLAAVRGSRVPFLLLGLGSNVLIPDAGLSGVVALLSGEFQHIRIEGAHAEAGAAVPLAQLVRQTVEQGLTGLEALAGFPSTVGGAVYMNAGCYGTEIKDVLELAVVLDPDGSRRLLTAVDLEPGYRRTNLQGSGRIVVRASFRLRPGDAAGALAVLEEFNRRRRKSLPSGRPNAGSIFKNPPGDFAGRLIEACGLKGRQHGGAEISGRHANVIVNRGGASALDVLQLMVIARRMVAERFQVALEPEIVLAGELGDLWRREAAAPRQ